MIWIVLILGLIAYTAGAYGTTKAIIYIRDYDYRRYDRIRVPLRCSSNYVGVDESYAFWWGIFWLPLGLLSVVYDLNRVDWNKEQRRIMRQIDSEKGNLANRNLEDYLEKARETRRAKLQEELNRLESDL